MNREILFRGKCVSDSKYAGEWVTGGYVAPDSDCKKRNEGLIVEYFGGNTTITYHVDTDTVGEFTGMRDKHGKKVFEGDVVRRRESALGYVKTGVVKYDCHLGAFVLEYESYGQTCKSTFDNEFSENDGNCTIRGTYSYEIIGNVYDNPDLLLSK